MSRTHNCIFGRRDTARDTAVGGRDRVQEMRYRRADRCRGEWKEAARVQQRSAYNQSNRHRRLFGDKAFCPVGRRDGGSASSFDVPRGVRDEDEPQTTVGRRRAAGCKERVPIPVRGL